MPISIGIPFYNAEQTLLDAIRSVFAQTYQDWELLLIDDGSTDNSLEIAQSVKDSRVRVISDGQNRMLPYRLNQIVAESKYDLIARMDADDLMFPERLEIQQRYFDNPKIMMVCSNACQIDTKNIISTLMSPLHHRSFIPINTLLGYSGIIHPTVMARRDWFIRNPYNPSLEFSEDYELWIRTSLNAQLTDDSLVIFSEPLLFYRKTEQAIVKKLILSERVKRRVIGKYGTKILGQFQTTLVIINFRIKMLLIRCLLACGLKSFYFKYISRTEQSKPLIKEDKILQLQNKLNNILSTPLPIQN
jgi:glycosyltransferase involved in cell wall biosynthesis